MMRPLVMDFREDTKATDQSYEFMFGKALLIAPITEPNVKEWNVYLPESADWYDFWTGKNFKGGQMTKTDAPLNTIPLFVKAGSIIPMGKFIQYAGQKSADTLAIRVYEGSNGEFTLYEDENDNYNYERGAFSTIIFVWNNIQKTLTINDRKGSFPGMLKERTFTILLVNENKGNGVDMSSTVDRKIKYSGKKTIVDF